MKRLKLSRWAAVFTLAIALTSAAASARAEDLSISGTFYNHQLQGVVGADLAGVLASNSGRWWTLTAYDVTYSNDFSETEYYDYYGYYHYESQSITRLHATSFELEFFGPDAAVLDAAVSQQLTAGSLAGGALLEMRNVYRVDEYPYYYYYYYYYGTYHYYQTYSTWNLGLEPVDPGTGVSFSSGDSYLGGYAYAFPVDASGYPMVVPQRLYAEQSTITDNRPGNAGALLSSGDIVDIGSAEPPLPPTLTIADGSKLEGQRGSNSLQLTVTLSRTTSNVVTVAYRTVNGTATAGSKDYVAANGTLTIPANQLQGTITVQIKPDRKREPNETFTVQLSSPVNATISDGTATVTILNDD